MVAYLRFLADTFSTPLGMAFLGLVFGSFVNMLAYRLPLMMERQWWFAAIDQLRDREGWRLLAVGELPIDARQVDAAGTRLTASAPITLFTPSSCPHCGHVIEWHENIPVLSWLLLRGRCSSCSNPISWLYPLGEALCGLACLAFAWQLRGSVHASHALVWVVFVALLCAAAEVDIRAMFLPDALTMPLLWAGVLFAALGLLPVTVGQSLAGIVCGYATLSAVAWCFANLTGRHGLGLGDIKLVAALGAWVGAPALIAVVALAAAGSLVVGLVRRRTLTERGAFGPYLALAGCVTALGRPLLLPLGMA
jgi:leader peptidase (prepilin peptidase)/N-methyltransferase